VGNRIVTTYTNMQNTVRILTLTRKNIKNSFKINVLSAVLLAVSLAAYGAEIKVDKPNIIIFYADDLGWQDTQINDVDKPCPWETPNIDRFAEQSINFTQAYSPAPVCAPSRIALVSGIHPARLGKTSVRGGTPVVVPK